MNKDEYISDIKKELGFMPYDEVLKAEEYFNSYFSGTESCEEVIKRLGTPKEAAQRYCRNRRDNEKYKRRYENKSRNYTGWVIAIIAAVFLFPIWAPVLILSAAFIICLIVFMITVSFGTWLSGGAVILSGIFAKAAIADKLIQCGLGFLMFGVGLMLSWLLVWAFINISIWIIRKVTKS